MKYSDAFAPVPNGKQEYSLIYAWQGDKYAKKAQNRLYLVCMKAAARQSKFRDFDVMG